MPLFHQEIADDNAQRLQIVTFLHLDGSIPVQISGVVYFIASHFVWHT